METKSTEQQIEPFLVDLETCSRLLGGLSRGTLYRLIREQGLPTIHLRGRLLFSPSGISQWLTEQTTKNAA